MEEKNDIKTIFNRLNEMDDFKLYIDPFNRLKDMRSFKLSKPSKLDWLAPLITKFGMITLGKPTRKKWIIVIIFWIVMIISTVLIGIFVN